LNIVAKMSRFFEISKLDEFCELTVIGSVSPINNRKALRSICFIMKIFLICYLDYGTGSYPFPPHGWHERILFNVSQPPLNGPCFFNASMPYAEQVGVYLHEGGRYGEIAP